jgi:hypothetical protein
MRSPQKTDLQLNVIDYSIFMGSYVAIIDPICIEYKIKPTELRLMAAIDGLKKIFDWRLNGRGITRTQVSRMTGIADAKCAYYLRKLAERNYVSEDIVVEGKRKIYRYKLTKTGKTIVNKVTMLDKVHERIIEHLYKTRLLK